MAVAVDLKGVVKHLVDGTLHRNLCRICLLPLGVASENVFTKICKDDLEYSVADILGTVCQIKFSDSDNFNVCPECFKMAFNAYKLFMVAKRSEEILNYYVEELDRNVHAIETMREYHDSLCITFPDFSPPIEYIDFNIDQFLENRTVHTEPETEKEVVDPKPQPESLLKEKSETKLSKLDDEEFIIVVMGDSKTQSQPCKIKDGKVVIVPTEKPEENIPEILPKKKRRKREPMMTRTCSRCPVKYSFLSKLQMHMKVEHNVDLYVCKICKAIFESNQEYNIHLGTHLDVHQCNYCNLTFKKRESIIAHLKMHEDMKNSDSNLNICELCGTILASDELLSEHFEKKHIKKYTCYYCGKMYKGELSFETHIKKHEKMMNSADKKQAPGAAAGAAYPRARRRLVCAACGKDFVDERALLWHSMLHTDERPYTCDTCGRGFVSLNRRNQHALCAHSRPTRRCPLCPALFHLRSMVNTHIKKVHLKAHKRRNRTSKHYNVCWKTEAVPIQELSVSIQNEILELQTRVPEEEDYAVPGTSDYIPLEWDGK